MPKNEHFLSYLIHHGLQARKQCEILIGLTVFFIITSNR